MRVRPKWEKGDRSRVELVVKEKGTTGKPVPTTIETEWRIAYEETVVAVREGRPVEVRRKFTRHRRTKKVDAKGSRAKTRRRTSKLEGKTLRLAARADERAIRPQGSPEEGFEHGLDWSWLLPPGEVEAGGSWTIDGGWELAPSNPLFVLRVPCRLVKVRGKKTAEIAFRAGLNEKKPMLEGEARVGIESGKVLAVEWKERDEGHALGVTIERELRFERKLLPRGEEKDE